MQTELDIPGTSEESHNIFRTASRHSKCLKIVGVIIVFYITVTSIVTNIQLAANQHLCPVYNNTEPFFNQTNDTLDCEIIYKFVLSTEYYAIICVRGPVPFLQLREQRLHGSIKRFEVNLYHWMFFRRISQNIDLNQTTRNMTNGEE